MAGISRAIAATADPAGDAVRQVIRAYHGSPYDFDRFDASKIGTGEGAQAYGHGLYFAGEEAVAKQYRDDLKDMLDRPVPHELSEELNQVFAEYNDLIRKSGEWTKANPRAPGNPFLEPLGKAGAAYTDVQGRYHAAAHNPGRMYEVEIGHPEEALLNWDRPTAPSGGVGARAADVLRAVRPRDISASDLEYIKSIRPGGYAPPAYGSSIHGVEQSLRAMAKDPAGAAELRAAGIPGLKYLDGVSRQQGAGTRNYVVFPGAEDAIRILRKYSWLIPATLAADAVVNSAPDGRVAQ